MKIDDIIFICLLISAAIYGLYYFYKIIKEINRQSKLKREEWEQEYKKRQQEHEEWLKDWNRRNQEKTEKLRKLLRLREQSERARREAEEYERRYRKAEQQALAYHKTIVKSMNILEISNYPFTIEQLSQQRRKLSLKYHPDKEGGSEQKMKAINEAFDELKKVAQK